MGTVLEYLKEYGDYTLEEMPFGEVDSLILSQFSYLKFDEMLPGAEGAQAAGTEEQAEVREAGAEAERARRMSVGRDVEWQTGNAAACEL